MESKKVKEIKKGLEVCTGICNETCPYDSLRCLTDLSKDILTLINELEEYIEGNEQDAKAFVNGWHKDLETELKQFAERLKENAEIKKIVGEGWIVSYVEICNAIDETLKEFLEK